MHAVLAELPEVWEVVKRDPVVENWVAQIKIDMPPPPASVLIGHLPLVSLYKFATVFDRLVKREQRRRKLVTFDPDHYLDTPEEMECRDDAERTI